MHQFIIVNLLASCGIAPYVVGLGYQTGTTVTELVRTKKIQLHQVFLQKNNPQLQIMQLNAELLTLETVFLRTITGESTSFKFRILSNPSWESQWSQWSFYPVCKTDSLCCIYNGLRYVLEQTYTFRIYLLPFLHFRSIILFCVYILLYLAAFQGWCGVLLFVCSLTTHFPWKILLVLLYSSSWYSPSAFPFILLICPMVWYSWNFTGKLVVLSVQLYWVSSTGGHFHYSYYVM